jgi:hypothetical protein
MRRGWFHAPARIAQAGACAHDAFGFLAPLSREKMAFYIQAR